MTESGINARACVFDAYVICDRIHVIKCVGRTCGVRIRKEGPMVHQVSSTAGASAWCTGSRSAFSCRASILVDARRMITRILAQKARAALLAICISASPVMAESRPGALPDLRVAKGLNNIKEAWLADSTTRYRHFVLGAPYEAASFVVRTADNRIVKLTLPETSVFEDRQPRLVDLDGDGNDEIVLVRSQVGKGAAVAIIGLVDDRLKIITETPPTGHQNTWINPAGIADFDGDGILDIAYVQMPHVLGHLRIWTMRGGKLIEIGRLPDTSNHVAGSRDIGLSVVADFDGDGVADLALPSLDRRSLRFITAKGGLRELARVVLPAPAVADFRLEIVAGKPVVVVGLGGGRTFRASYP